MKWLLKTSAQKRRAKGLETVPAPENQFIAHVDGVDRDGKVWGWAALRDPEIRAAEVTISFDGRRGTPCESNLFRTDLLAAGFGDGYHSFVANLPRALQAAADSVSLVSQTERGEEVLATRPLTGVDRRTRPLVVFLEFSDLIVYLMTHRNVSGIQRTQCGFVLHLLGKKHSDFEYRLCCRDEGDLKFRDVSEAALRMLLTAASDTEVTQARWRQHCRAFWAQSALPIVCRDGDILVTLGAPWALSDHLLALSALRRRRSIRYYQILYDLIPLAAPEYVDPPLIPVFAEAIAGMLINADHVFSISDFTSSELMSFSRKHGIQCPPASVIKMGGTINDAVESRTPMKIEPSFGHFRPHDQSFVLFVGTLEPRKNHQLVVNIWQKLIAKYGIDEVPKLVLVGRIGWSVETLERQLRMTRHLDGAIVHLTKVSDPDLQILFETCMFTVFPSLYEGWGLPIVESLSYGKVCVTSCTTSMKEAGGDSAIYIDPLDFVGAFTTIEELIYDRDLLSRQTLKVKLDYKPVTWEDAAADLDRKIGQAMSLPATGDTSPPVGRLRSGRLYYLGSHDEPQTGDQAFVNADSKLRLLSALDDGEWYDPDDWGCWSCSPEPRLRFILEDGHDQDLVAYVKLRLWAPKPSFYVEVVVNGATQGRLAFDDEGYCHSQLRIPARENHTKVRHTIVFRIDPEHPIWKGVHTDSEDFKAIGLGVSSLYICPDVAVDRLQYLETFLAFPT